MQTGRGQPQRESSVIGVVGAPGDCSCPPISNEFFRSRVAHNCVQNGLTKRIAGDGHTSCYAIRSKGIKCVIYRIVDNSTAPQHVVIRPGKVKHKETQGCPLRHLHAKFALDDLEHHRAFAVVFQTITCATTATKDTNISHSVSLLEAVVCAPTVEYRTECSSTHPRCDQRMQAR